MTLIRAEDFASLPTADLIRHFEVEGFIIVPGSLDPEEIQGLKDELATLPMRPSFYSDAPCFAVSPPHWHGPRAGAVIANPPVVAFLERLLGEDITFIHSHYIVSHPGQPELEMHADYAPYGSTYSGWLESSPVRVRVLHYLDDTGTDRAPLKILPRSHISFHADSHPYHRYRDHPDAITVPMKAGDALVMAVRMFHGTGANTSSQTRGMLEYDYRPVWSRPMQPVEEWSPEQVMALPEAARRFVRGRNALDGRWEFQQFKTLDQPAPGISPARWG